MERGKAKVEMREMANLDYKFLAEELKEKLVGARFNKAYLTRGGSCRLKFHKQGELNLAIGRGRVHLTKYLEETEEPKGIFKAMREKLDNAFLDGIRQVNFDRVLELEFAKKEKFFLEVEMLGEGNIVLIDGQGKILAARKNQEFSSRRIRPKEEYKSPPKKGIPFAKVGEGDFDEMKGGVVNAVSRKVDLAPFYLEEACARAKIPLEEKIEGLGMERKKLLAEKIRELAEEKAEPGNYESVEGETIGFAPFRLKKMGATKWAPRESFSEALDEYYKRFFSEGGREKRDKAEEEKKRSKARAVLEGQEKALEEFEKAEEEERKKGEWIKKNLGVVEAVSEGLKKKKLEREIEGEIERDFGLKVSVKRTKEKAEIEF